MDDACIPVYQPSLEGNEKQYVNECLDSSWISSKGRFVTLFEESFQSYTGARYATSVSNGTVAIYLALSALGVGPGDEVIVPTFTYVASVNPIAQLGATPVFVDSERDSWQIDPSDVRRKLTPRTRAIIAVHLYGHPADMPAIMEIARAHDLFVVEDCAEALGARIGDQHVGNFGDFGTFSFYGNKTVTTGEGGMVITNDGTLLERAVHLKGQGLAAHRTYWHDIAGYNFRMTNICAAIGLAQMERVHETVRRKQDLARRYDCALQGLAVEPHRSVRDDIVHSYWMYTVLVPPRERDAVIAQLAREGIETRPTFYPVHTMPMYSRRYGHHPVAQELAQRGINLPSWPGLSDAQVQRVASALGRALEA